MVDSNELNSSYYIEYFKIIQSTIDRLARNSFLIKTWAITLIGSISILTFSIINSIIFSVLIGIVLIFWILDSYYLKLERLYRILYEENVEKFNNSDLRVKILLFDMKTDKYQDRSRNILKAIFSKTEVYFYLSLILGLLILLVTNIIIQ